MDRDERLTRLEGILRAQGIDPEIMLENGNLGASDGVLAVRAVVGVHTREPGVTVEWRGAAFAMPPEAARTHAWNLVHAAALAESEAYLLEWATRKLGEHAAAQILVDFRKWRALRSAPAGKPV